MRGAVYTCVRMLWEEAVRNLRQGSGIWQAASKHDTTDRDFCQFGINKLRIALNAPPRVERMGPEWADNVSRQDQGPIPERRGGFCPYIIQVFFRDSYSHSPAWLQGWAQGPYAKQLAALPKSPPTCYLLCLPEPQTTDNTHTHRTHIHIHTRTLAHTPSETSNTPSDKKWGKKKGHKVSLEIM